LVSATIRRAWTEDNLWNACAAAVETILLLLGPFTKASQRFFSDSLPTCKKSSG
jgi:hypothetical protein